jgi:hypothetical protein
MESRSSDLGRSRLGTLRHDGSLLATFLVASAPRPRTIPFPAHGDWRHHRSVELLRIRWLCNERPEVKYASSIVRISAFAAGAAAAFAMPRAAAGEARPTPPAVTYSDGAVARAMPECGASDLCATITLPNQDTMRIYNRGSKRCEPFTLHLATLHGDTVVLDSDVKTATQAGRNRDCPLFANTYLTFDSGKIRMGVFLAKNGNLFMEFFPGAAH